MERSYTLTFVHDILHLVEETSDCDENIRKIVALAAQMVLQNHQLRWRQLISAWNLHFRRLQLMARIKYNMSMQYCLPRKSQLLMQHVYSDRLDVRKNFRVSKATFRFVCRMVQRPTSTAKDHGWPERLEVLIFLYWLASGAAYRSVASKFGMPKSTVNDIIHRVLNRFLGQMDKIVYLPRGDDEFESIARGFASVAESGAMDRVLGCVDCFHVGIRPPRTLEQYYVNERLFHSIKCQLVVDHRGIVRDVFIGFPGSVHDSQVLTLSPLRLKSSFPPPGYCLLADNAYPAGDEPPQVITPFAHAAPGTCESYYNHCHRRAWMVVDTAVVSMKARWNRVFSQYLDASNRLAPKIVAACVMLHNITLMTGDRVVVETPNYDDDAVAVGRAAGAAVTADEPCEFRDEIIRRMLVDFATPVVDDHDYV